MPTLRTPLIILLMLTITGCTTTRHEPESDQSALVVGTLVLEARNFGTSGAASVNGRQGSGIEITVVNEDTDAVERVNTFGRNGLFLIPVEPDARYRLQEVHYRTETNTGSWAYVYTRPNNFRFQSEAGTVTNLGRLQWVADGREESYRVTSGGEKDMVRELFESRYSESEWLTRPWSQ